MTTTLTTTPAKRGRDASGQTPSKSEHRAGTGPNTPTAVGDAGARPRGADAPRTASAGAANAAGKKSKSVFAAAKEEDGSERGSAAAAAAAAALFVSSKRRKPSKPKRAAL